MREADLVARVVLRADQHAFTQLVRLHQSSLRLFLRRLTCGDAALADDLAQETFLAAFKSVGSFRNRSSFRSWLFGIAVNRFRSEARKTHHRVEVFENTAEPSTQAPQERQILQREVLSAMSALSEAERVALSLCSGMGLSHAEAASIMEIPVGTVKTHVLRGKKKLQTTLEGKPTEPKALPGQGVEHRS